MRGILISALVVGCLGIAAVIGGAYLLVDHYFVSAQEPATSVPNNSIPAGDSNLLKLDSDGDGLTDRDEIEKYYTDPQKVDTDQDGFTDKEEIDNGYNPLAKPGT